MSFTDLQVGLETYDGSLQLLWPHPPVVHERYQDQLVATVVGFGIKGHPVVVQVPQATQQRHRRILVRTLTASDVATLQQLRDATGLLYLKLAAGVSTVELVAFGPEDDQEVTPMVADHPETKGDGSAVDGIFLVYEANLQFVRME